MRVVCRSCTKLIPEELAIKMSMVGYKTFEMIKYEIEFIQLSEWDYNHYTQVCEECYYSVYRRKQ